MRRLLTFAIFLSLLTGCADIASFLSTPQPAPAPTGTAIPVTPTAITASPTATPSGPRTLRLWLIPQFDPSSGSPAGELLQERLDEFISDHPELQIDVRIKAESGPSGIINALATTKTAAPSIMPDIVALSRPDLESAAAKGLLLPLDDLTSLTEGSDWYPYARQMARIQNSAYGLPFAGDALLLIGFRSPLPSSWTEMPEETLFLFPAADPRALFTLSLYLSAGGNFQDNQGQLAANETILSEVLSLYVQDEENDFISPQAINYETNAQAWNAFREQRGNLVIGWASRYLNYEEATPLAAAPLPGLETGQHTLATGWSWALSGSNPENDEAAVELAEFLSDSQFLAEWTQAAGYLPTRSSALSAWEDAALQVVLDQAAESATLVPGQDVMVTIGPLFSQAALSVLKGEQEPDEAAQSVTEQLE